MSKALLTASTLLTLAVLTKAIILPAPLKATGKQNLNGEAITFPLYLKLQNLPPDLKPEQKTSKDPEPPKPNYKWNFEASIHMEGFGQTNTTMVIDINYRNILIPVFNRPGRDSGIKCEKDQKDPNSKDSCVYSSNEPLQDTMDQDHWAMYGQKPEGFRGTNTWAWTEGVSNESKRFKIGALTTPSADWVLDDAGILGMGSETSTASLWTYLFEVYEPSYGYFYTTFYLTTYDTLDIPQNKNYYWWQMFNPSLNTSNVYQLFNGSEFRISDDVASILDDPVQADFPVWIPNLKAGSNSQTWGIGAVKVYSSDLKEPIATNANVCFAMNSNATFLFPQKKLDEFKEKSLLAVCRGAKCGPGSFLLNAADITLLFNDVEGKEKLFTITPGAYLYNNTTDYVQVSVDLIDKYQGNGCDPALKNQIGLGKMFFYQYQVVFRMSPEGEASIGLFNYKTRPRFAHYAKVDTLVITGLVFVLFLFVCIMGLRWKGISEAGDDEEVEEELPDAYKKASSLPSEGDDDGEEEKVADQE